VNKDPDNLAKKSQEGWEPVRAGSGDVAKPVDSNKIEEGKNLTSVYEKRDVMLHRIPEELAEGRDEFFNQKSSRQVAGLTSHIKRDMASKGGNAPVHGEITISSRKGTTTLE
jgi:hypothetical protein